MDNRRAAAIVLVIVGLGAVNFFYLSDLIIDRTAEPGIIIGWKSAAAIIVANMIAIAGIFAAMGANKNS